jgi:hypothetical protein
MRVTALNRTVLVAAVAATCAFQPLSSRAELIPTDRAGAAAGVENDREKVRAFLSREDAERSMTMLGVAPQVAKERVDALTDAEVTSLAAQIDKLPAGGALSTMEMILIVLIAILVAVLI